MHSNDFQKSQLSVLTRATRWKNGFMGEAAAEKRTRKSTNMDPVGSIEKKRSRGPVCL